MPEGEGGHRTAPHQRVAGEGPNREIGGQTRVPRRIGRGDGRAVIRMGRPRVSPPMAAGSAGCLRVQRSRVLRGRDERRRSRKHGGERRMKAGGGRRAAHHRWIRRREDERRCGLIRLRADGTEDRGARSIVASWGREVGQKPAAAKKPNEEKTRRGSSLGRVRSGGGVGYRIPYPKPRVPNRPTVCIYI